MFVRPQTAGSLISTYKTTVPFKPVSELTGTKQPQGGNSGLAESPRGGDDQAGKIGGHSAAITVTPLGERGI